MVSRLDTYLLWNRVVPEKGQGGKKMLVNKRPSTYDCKDIIPKDFSIMERHLLEILNNIRMNMPLSPIAQTLSLSALPGKSE